MVSSRAVSKIGLSCVVFFVLAAVLATPSVATIIRGGDGSGTESRPGDDPGWDNVGRLGGGSAVYLGNGWALTARHVWDLTHPTTVVFGSTYGIEADSWHFLHDPVDSNIDADLALFRLSSNPAGLADLTISESAPPDASEVVGIGFGSNRAASETSWDLNWNEVTPPAPYHGFNLVDGREKRWGENHIEGTDLVSTNDDAYTTECLAMDFSRFLGAGDHEMQVVPGDSGGGLFYKDLDGWELAGILVARSTLNGEPPSQPRESAVYTNKSFAADLSRYEGQIAGVIPEPSALVMLLGLGAGCLVWLGWRRASRPVGR
ncbi:MAG: trypsin-like peptidase domain-containing protein [Planctomycetota bacterium]|jgi:hypothetical protein